MEKKLKKVELMELNEAYNKVLYWFFSFPNMEIGLNDLSENLSISKTTAKKVINRMVEENFLIKKVYGKAWGITCNKDHYYNYTRKVAFNLTLVYDFYEDVRFHIFSKVGNSKAVVLFGSYRKGDDIETSDIDLAIEVADNKELKIIESGFIPLFGYREKVKVNLHIFSRNKIDINFFSNIANGIVLEGFLEVRP